MGQEGKARVGDEETSVAAAPLLAQRRRWAVASVLCPLALSESFLTSDFSSMSENRELRAAIAAAGASTDSFFSPVGSLMRDGDK